MGSIFEMFRFILLFSSGTFAEQCLVCKSTTVNMDQGTTPTIQPTFGVDGKSCFEPISGENKLGTTIGDMKKDCVGGCYSLIYSIQSAHSNLQVQPSSKVVEYYVERGCKKDSPLFPTVLTESTNYDEWTSITLNEKNFGIKGTLSAYVSTKAVPSGVEANLGTKLNWPKTSQGTYASPPLVGGSSTSYLSCYEEKRIQRFSSKTTFTTPGKKVRCGLHENRCFSSITHIKKNSDNYFQYAHRGCVNANSTMLNPINKPYYIKGWTPQFVQAGVTYNRMNATHIVEFCDSDGCNNKVQAYTVASAQWLGSSILALLVLLLN